MYKVNSEFSYEYDDDIGVSQGSVLCPLLFLFFMDDLFKSIDYCMISVYANDIFILSLIEHSQIIIHKWFIKIM